MSKFGSRINVDKSEGSMVVTIRAFRESSKQNLLLFWIILWSACGVYVISQFFTGQPDGDMKTFLVIYTGFWLYFEYKVIYAYRWRNAGSEVIKLTEDRLSICRQIGNRGIPRYYSIDHIKNMRVFEDTSNGFIKTMNNSYWMVSGETLAFDYQGKLIVFGRQLDNQDASAVSSLLKHEVRERKH